MSSQSGFIGIWCKRCDQTNQPCRLVRQMAGKQDGMLLKCPQCGYQAGYAAVMASQPRMDKPEFVEKQPPGTQTVPLWLHPEALAALQHKFPSNLLTTLHSAVTALADPDSVLIEGQYAREMASIGVKTGREVLALAKEVKELRETVTALRLREETLRQFFGGLGMAMPQPLAAQPPSPSADLTAPPLDASGNPLSPPRADFVPLIEGGGEPGPIAPTSQFTFPSGAAPAADTRPAFVTTNLGR